MLIYQAAPRYLDTTLDDNETAMASIDEEEYQPFTTTIFPNFNASCKKCSLGCDEESHYKMSLIFEI